MHRCGRHAGRCVHCHPFRQDRIMAMDILADPERLRAIDLAVLDE